MKRKEILVKILTRARRNPLLVENYFVRAGLPVNHPISLENLKGLMDINPDLFSELMDKLFPDAAQVFGVANAEGAFDWKGFLGATLDGIGNGFMMMSDSAAANTAADNAIANAQYQADMAAQESAKTKQTLWIVLGILVVVIVAAVFIFKKRF
ncbi:MAG: hypothetical protein IKA83_06015 [Paludibacteraceae bacterium]|nr:hypothetical protein [Paludibacteraceae bacterium]